MSLATTVQTTTKEELRIKPTVKAKLMRRLKTYAELRAQVKALEAAMDKEKAEIGLLREEVGVTSLAIEGFKVTQVTSTRSSLNKMKLIAMGCTTEMLEECTDYKPGKPYTKISVPGEKESSAD